MKFGFSTFTNIDVLKMRKIQLIPFLAVHNLEDFPNLPVLWIAGGEPTESEQSNYIHHWRLNKNYGGDLVKACRY